MADTGKFGEVFEHKLFSREGVLRELKADLPDLYRDQSRVEFIKDFIALANSAWYWGRPAFLIYGLDDDQNLVGISDESFERYRQKLSGGGTKSVTDSKVWEDAIERLIHQLLHEYVSPYIAFHVTVRYGTIGGRKRVAYLVVPPLPSGPFKVKKDYKVGRWEIYLHQGDCWIREGASKLEVRNVELTSAASGIGKVKRLLPQEWEDYLRKLQATIAVPWNGNSRLDLYSLNGEKLEEYVIEEFLPSPFQHLLIIKGRAGAGKTFLSRTLVNEIAESTLHELELSREKEEFRLPSGWIPVFLTLRGYKFSESYPLDKLLVDQILYVLSFKHQVPEKQELLLSDENLQWVVFLDGFDEIFGDSDKKGLFHQIDSFKRKHPHIKIVLTTRPDVVIPFPKGKEIVEKTVALLEDEQIEEYIASSTSEGLEETEVKRIISFLNANTDIKDLCRVPLNLAVMKEVALDSPSQLTEEEIEAWEALFSKAASASSTRSKTQGKEEPLDNETHFPVEEIIADVTKQIESQAPDNGLSPSLDQTGKGSEDSSLEQDVVIPLKKGIILENLFRRLWEREKKRYVATEDKFFSWYEEIGRLAAVSDGKRDSFPEQFVQKTAPSLMGGNKLAWYIVLSLGWLERVNNGAWWVRFFPKITKTFFAAEHIKPYLMDSDISILEEDDVAKTIQEGKRAFWQEVLDLLRDMVYVDLAPLEKIIEGLPQ